METVDVFPLEKVPDLVLLCIANHLPNEDARHLSLTCQRFRKILPNYPHIINGLDVNERGPRDGHFVPTNYFQGPVLEYNVERIEMSMAWWDQGHGNSKGQVWLKLLRPRKNEQAKLITEMIPHKFGIAPHQKPPKMPQEEFVLNCVEFEDNAKEILTQTDEIVKLAQPGDCFEIMKNVGGGGGHSLYIRNFKLKIYYKRY